MRGYERKRCEECGGKMRGGSETCGVQGERECEREMEGREREEREDERERERERERKGGGISSTISLEHLFILGANPGGLTLILR